MLFLSLNRQPRATQSQPPRPAESHNEANKCDGRAAEVIENKQSPRGKSRFFQTRFLPNEANALIVEKFHNQLLHNSTTPLETGATGYTVI